MSGPREPSMEDILASIKRVIAEEKEIRAAAPPPLPEPASAGQGAEHGVEEDDVLELDEQADEGPSEARQAHAEEGDAQPTVEPFPLAEETRRPAPSEAAPDAGDIGETLVDTSIAAASRSQLEQLASLAAAAPPPAAPPANPLEELVREMLRPLLKQWLDDHLPRIVDEHVKREITRITGRRI
ncbi:DUF2497 domain-containing protein [Sphingomonas sp. ASV193]|uniref:DUF2497 domain-containing protein n=1 Tax=Sphingomonas sp. ASV193 TaxID=3144405 RepID=UPI0032E8D284